MQRGLWNMDHASFFTEATFIDIGVYMWCFIDVWYTCEADSYPVTIYVFSGWERIGGYPRAPQPNPQSSLTPKT